MALRPLSRAKDFAFPDGAWDVRGWTVRTELDDDRVGRVEDMLLDHTGGLRYLDVNLGFLKKHVLVPLDHAFAERESETVWIEGLTKQRLEEVPEYALDPEALDEGYERRLDAVYGGTSASTHASLVAPHAEPDAELELRRMADLEDDYRVAGEDPRGWKVVTGEGRTVGRVAELLMDPGAMKARYLDVAVDEKELELEPVDRHILLPSDRVRLDRSKKRVVVSGLLAHDLTEYPQYGGLPLTHRSVGALDEVFERAATAKRRREEIATDDHDHVDWQRSTLRHFYSTKRRARSRATEEGIDG